MLSYLIFPLSVLIITIIILSTKYKNQPKTDKGFQICYFKLSYRRKMIRGLTALPITIGTLIVIWFHSGWSTFGNLLFALLAFFALALEFLYNYIMWKKKEKYL